MRLSLGYLLLAAGTLAVLHLSTTMWTIIPVLALVVGGVLTGIEQVDVWRKED